MLSACGDQDTTTFANEAARPAAALGALQLPLVTPTQQTYRLRQGIFDVSSRAGALVATLDSERGPETSELRVDLPQGPYDVTLHDGWSIEQLADAGPGTVVSAALISENPRAVEIRAGQVSSITYSFMLDQGVITLGEGALSVSLNVEANAFFTDCYVLSPCGVSGQSRLLADASGRTFCAEPGSLPVGAPCNSQQCVSGAQCLGLDAAHPEQRSCTRFCNIGASEFGCNCLSLGLSNQSYGVCGPPPEGSCDLLTQTGCATEEACQYHGGPFARCGHRHAERRVAVQRRRVRGRCL